MDGCAGDMSGSVRSAPPKSGQWSAIYTSESVIDFSNFTVSWNASNVPCTLPDQYVRVVVAVSNDTLVWTPEETIPASGFKPPQSLPIARYYRVTVRLTRCPADDRSPEVLAVIVSDGTCYGEPPSIQGASWPPTCNGTQVGQDCLGSCNYGYYGTPKLTCNDAGEFVLSGNCTSK